MSVIRCYFAFTLPRSVNVPEIARYSFNQSNAKRKPIVTQSPTFFCVSGNLLVSLHFFHRLKIFEPLFILAIVITPTWHFVAQLKTALFNQFLFKVKIICGSLSLPSFLPLSLLWQSLISTPWPAQKAHFDRGCRAKHIVISPSKRPERKCHRVPTRTDGTAVLKHSETRGIKLRLVQFFIWLIEKDAQV